MAFVSPGVFSREIDLSLFAQKLSTSVVGIVGVFTKGPLNVPTLITNLDSLVNTFGPPRGDVNTNPEAQAWFHAREYLREGAQLYVVRVGDSGDLAKSFLDLDDGAATDAIRVESATDGTWLDGWTLEVSAGTFSGIRIDIRDTNDILLFTLDNLANSTPSTDIPAIAQAINDTVPDLNAVVLDDTVNLASPTGPQTFAGGGDGLVGISDSDVIGTISGNTRTGLKLFKNAETLDLNMMMAPGFGDPDIVNEIITVCQQRADCLGVVDTPSGLDVQNVVDWHNGQGAFLGSHAAFDSSYAAMYWSHGNVKDEFNDIDNVLISPAGAATGAMAFTDRITEPWFAPAGFNRGKVRSFKSLEYSPDLGERELLYGPGNNINPLVNFVKDGVVIFGQKTLQRKPTLLDRVNVRRMLLVVEKTIASSVKFLTFEPKDPATFRQFIGLVTPVLDNVLTRRGIRQYQVQMDTTTQEGTGPNEMRGKLFIEPTTAAEVINLDYIITPQGADFSELVTSV